MGVTMLTVNWLVGSLTVRAVPPMHVAPTAQLEALASEAGALDSHFALVLDSSAIQHCCPYVGKVISPFGVRGGRKHTGSDIKLQHGDTVKAALKGVVKMARSYSGYGKLVILTHLDGYETYYSHLSTIRVKEGETVYAGQPVGLGGRTGRATTNHLHFEVRRHGKPLNPENFFDFASGTLKKPLVVGTRELLFVVRDPVTDDGKPTPAANMGASTNPGQPSSQPVVSVKAAIRPTANAAPAISETSEDQAVYVRVQKGDTLYSLSKRHGTTVAQLQALNQLNGTLLKIGQRIRVR